MQLAALILGILGFVFLALPFAGVITFGVWTPLICFCLALIFGHIGKARQQGRGLALTGFILGILGIVIWILLAILVLIGLAVLASAPPSTYVDPAAEEAGLEQGDDEGEDESDEADEKTDDTDDKTEE